MAICVSQAVLTDNVTGESELSVQSMTSETELLPKCGRLVFRGVELAYLNINGKQMLPLAEMLALMFGTTPRTTLFTRMEKINAQRHFCQPLEIKLLKTVNGIHGSSANCTLIPKEDVERYCSIYIDKEVEVPTPCRGPRTEKKVPRTDDCNEIIFKAVKTMDSANLDKVAEVAAHKNNSSDFVKKVANIDGARRINSLLTSPFTRTESINIGEETTSIAGNDGNACFSAAPSSQDQEHASNSTQTVSMLSWATKPKQANNVNVIEVNKNAKLERTKKRKPVVSAVDQDRRKFNSPSQEHKKLPKKGGILGESNSAGKSPKPRKRRNVALALNVDLSDDSGFTSLSFEESSPTKLEIKGTHAKLKCDVTSPHRSKKQKSEKSSILELSDILNLSPPPLVIKKLQNTWLVETKLDGVKKELYKPKKKKMTGKKMSEGNVVNGLLATYSSANKQPLVKKKQERKMRDINGVQSPTLEQVVGAGGTNPGKKKRRRRKRVEARTNQAINGVTPGLEFLVTPEKKEKVVKKGKKKSKIGGTPDSLASVSSLGDRTDVSAPQTTPQSKRPLKHASPSGTKLTPVKPPVLKATPNFSLMNLFPSTPGLIVYDGDLSPELTMACDPNVAKPHPSHPVWKWRIGGPVIAKTHRVNFRIRKIKQPHLKSKPYDHHQAKVINALRPHTL